MHVCKKGNIFKDFNSMKYYVYVNRPEPKARIHEESCPHCNNGTGCHNRSSKTKHGEWFGPFTFEKANIVAKETNKPISKCKHCLNY
jgi:hypothetical protein